MLRRIYVFLASLPLFLASAVGAETPPQVHVLHSKALIGAEVADRIVRIVKKNNAQKKPTVLGLATGSSPIPVYEELRRLFKEDTSLDLSNVVTFNLDEYVNLAPSHPQSYHHFMFTHLFTEEVLYSPANPRGIKRENIHLPEADLSNIPAEKHGSFLQSKIEEYEALVKEKGPIDLQILGIGENGHIAFAEPGSAHNGRTMIVTLDESTRQTNSRFFEDDPTRVPTQAITMGIGTILEAKEIALIATGSRKAEAIRATLEDSISPQVPASALRLHSNTSFFIDEEAASKTAISIEEELG